MNWEYIEARWTIYQGVAAGLWPKLTADELAETRGDRVLLGRALKLRYGFLSDFAEQELDRFYSRCAGLTERNKGAFPSGNLLEPPEPDDEYISS